MIEDLSITNFALIDKISVDFTTGLNILTGETGAGKSILIGALSFLLGGKGGVEQIRAGATEARVSGTIILQTNQLQAHTWLQEKSIEPENNRILVRRVIRDTGKSSAWIGEVAVTRGELAEFTSFLVDIHGQHEHQSLMKTSEHRKFLDSYAGIVPQVEAFTKLYNSLLEKRKLLEQMNTSDSERLQKIDLLSFAIEEINSANLNPKEEDELIAEESRLNQYEK
ncbi:MAG: AAA family ATPase, partial [Treponemataceae bacterium]